jgi:hypothetical protein
MDEKYLNGKIDKIKFNCKFFFSNKNECLRSDFMFENALTHKILNPKMITYSYIPLHSIFFNLSGFIFDIFIGEGPKPRQVIIVQLK